RFAGLECGTYPHLLRDVVRDDDDSDFTVRLAERRGDESKVALLDAAVALEPDRSLEADVRPAAYGDVLHPSFEILIRQLGQRLEQGHSDNLPAGDDRLRARIGRFDDEFRPANDG